MEIDFFPKFFIVCFKHYGIHALTAFGNVFSIIATIF